MFPKLLRALPCDETPDASPQFRCSRMSRPDREFVYDGPAQSPYSSINNREAGDRTRGRTGWISP